MIMKFISFLFLVCLGTTGLSHGNELLPTDPAPLKSGINYPDHTDFYKDFSLEKTYFYDDDGNISSIDYYKDGDLFRRERFFWTKTDDNWLVRTRIWEDNAGHALLFASYQYNTDFGCIETLHGNLFANPPEPLEVDNQGNLVAPATNSLVSAFQNRLNSAKEELEDFRRKLSHEEALFQNMTELAKGDFDEIFLTLSGIFESKGTCGLHNPGKELNPKVKITLINGILTLKKNLHALAEMISNTHGDNQIYYVYRPTEGWTRDVFGCAFAWLGVTSKSAEMLAGIWKELIAEMGGTEGGGLIIHYSYSIGATDTYLAKDFLTPEERKMIEVITIGSPTLINSSAGFRKVSNYASVRDGVVQVGNPLKVALGMFVELEDVYFVGSHLEGLPLEDHLPLGKTYREIVEARGKAFVEKYGAQ
jgi:hypothetical protein